MAKAIMRCPKCDKTHEEIVLRGDIPFVKCCGVDMLVEEIDNTHTETHEQAVKKQGEGRFPFSPNYTVR
jgi:hypothetical protein